MITKEKVEEILQIKELKKGVEIYIYLQKRLYETDVTKDEEFQKIFRNFYQLRRFYSDEFARRYFKILENMKDIGEEMTFEMALERVKHIQGTYEMSFSSKMANIINPAKPIWDSVVTTGHFHMRAPAASAKDREKACIRKYDEYEKAFYQYLQSEEGMMILTLFDNAFPDTDICNVKKIDFVLWQDR